jgi:hypothetical protein
MRAHKAKIVKKPPTGRYRTSTEAYYGRHQTHTPSVCTQNTSQNDLHTMHTLLNTPRTLGVFKWQI